MTGTPAMNNPRYRFKDRTLLGPQFIFQAAKPGDYTGFTSSDKSRLTGLLELPGLLWGRTPKLDRA